MRLCGSSRIKGDLFRLFLVLNVCALRPLTLNVHILGSTKLQLIQVLGLGNLKTELLADLLAGLRVAPPTVAASVGDPAASAVDDPIAAAAATVPTATANQPTSSGSAHGNTRTTANHAPVNALSALMNPSNSTCRDDGVAGTMADEFYRGCMLRGGNLPEKAVGQNKTKGKFCLHFFNAMATDEERSVLYQTPRALDHQATMGREARRSEIMKLLVTLVRAKLVHHFEEGRIKLPPILKDAKQLRTTSIDSLLTTLRGGGVTVIVDRDLFATWRATYMALPSSSNTNQGPSQKRKAPP
jgi:hypothetical protein